MNDSKVVEKILRTLSEKFIYVVVSIEEYKEIQSIQLDELESSLIVHEQKFRKPDKGEDQVLKVTHARGMGSRGRGFNGRGRGRGRGRDKSTVECYKCHRLGHFQNECPKWEEEANYADFDEKEEMLLMAYIEEEDSGSESDMSIEETAEKMLMTHIGKNENMRKIVWFLASGYSNHMSGDRNMFSTMNDSFRHSVKLGNDKQMEVVGKGNIKLELNHVVCTISDVYYIPELKNNLLSLGQLQERDLTVIIQKGVGKIFHEKRTHGRKQDEFKQDVHAV